MQPKSKGVAYLLWFFLGIIGAHKFYLGKVVTGIIYILTGALLGIGWLYDLFTLGSQVDMYNALRKGGNQQQNQNVVVNVGSSEASGSEQPKMSAEKQILQLADEKPQLTLRDVITRTSLESEEAHNALERMNEKGLVQESVDENGRKYYEAG
jgi:TM2 domain-containing membrane protein YozV